MDAARRQVEVSERRAAVEAELARLSTATPSDVTGRAASWAVVAAELSALSRLAAPGPCQQMIGALIRLVEALRAGNRPAGQAALGLVGEGLHDFESVCAAPDARCEDLTGAMELVMADLAVAPAPASAMDIRLEDFGRPAPETPRRRRASAAALAAEGAMRLEAVWSGLADYVRRQGEALGKRVELVATGGELEVSGRAGEALRPALLQLVRNACAHGVESPAARQGAGKPRLAILRLSARRAGDRVEVTLADDGRGLDKAREPGPAATFDPGGLILATGVLQPATAPRAGLELVRGAVEDVGGQMRSSSTPGRGAAFTLTLPAPPAPPPFAEPHAVEPLLMGARA